MRQNCDILNFVYSVQVLPLRNIGEGGYPSGIRPHGIGSWNAIHNLRQREGHKATPAQQTGS